MSPSPPKTSHPLLRRLRNHWPWLTLTPQGNPHPRRDFTPLKEKRFVVLDVETTGLDIRTDQLLSIGAIAICQGEITLGDHFTIHIRQLKQVANESTLLHGLTPSLLQTGENPATALKAFLAYTGQAHLLAFHAPFDRAMLKRGIKHALGSPWKTHFWDVADVASALYPEQATRLQSLDAWLEHFGVEVAERHNAFADAMATAELMLILLKKCDSQAIETVAQLDEKIRICHRLRQMGR
ncbi:MAG: 3'-5' exonuclease [Hahellaceae bacterium]|nr:3'-5' exonuclease [Hahellaceae bacterium]